VIHALEARHAPVVSLWVWYHVGGRNEVPGTTGMSHFLEHMLFKGTPAHPKGDLDRLLARYGAQWNAFTNEDVTCYFETVPRDRYEVALELEADRMSNALISTEEVEAERTVIVSEREGLENDPSFLLGESLQAVAFDRHPYGQGVIGSKFEIKHMTRDGLYAHYKRHYAPNNAYVVVVGDDRAEALVEKAATAFGPVRMAEPSEPPFAPEPPQMGEKRLVVHRAGGALPIVQLGRSSRLYRGLVEKELATEIDASFGLTKDPFLFTIEATVRPGVTHRAVEDALLEELRRLGDEPIDATEFARVRRGLLASVAFPSDTITWRAFRLGSLLSSGAAQSIGAWYDALAKVTPDEVQRAARETFVERSRTVGHFIPEAG
jgi:zinc protease